MPTDILLEYLIDSISSMPVYLDENVLTELEDSWRWRHTSPGFFTDDDEDEFILDWTRDALAEPDVLGVVDSEFNQVCISTSCSILCYERRTRNSHWQSKARPFFLTFEPPNVIVIPEACRKMLCSGSSMCFAQAS